MKKKKCIKCKKAKYVSEFHNDKNKKYGVREQCKDCVKIYTYAHNYYKKNKCLICGKLIKNKSTFCSSCCKLNRKHSIETKLFMSKKQIGKNNSMYGRLGKNNPNYKGGFNKCTDCGKQTSRHDTKRCLKCSIKFKIGENHPNWKGGISKAPYSFEFTKELKAKIRERDQFKCQRCGLKEKNNYRNKKQINLTVHHIDYNKQNCKEDNLITVCNKCNFKANYNRDYWYAFYRYIIENWMK